MGVRKRLAGIVITGKKPDSFERSQGNSTLETAAKGTAIVVPIAAATLWLTKGKWNKLRNLFKRNPVARTNTNNTIIPTSNPNAMKTLRRQQKKVDIGVSREEAKRKVDEAINGIELPPKSDAVEVIKGIETAKANNKSRKLVEQAIEDNPTSKELRQYAKEMAYKAPTRKEKQVIQRVNTEAEEKSATARQIQNNISEEKKQVFIDTKKSMDATVTTSKTGIFRTSDGYTVKLENGNIVSMVTPRGEIITKPKTIYKRQGEIDLTKLEEVKS